MATAEFSKFAGILSAALSQHHLSGFERAQPPRPPGSGPVLVSLQTGCLWSLSAWRPSSSSSCWASAGVSAAPIPAAATSGAPAARKSAAAPRPVSTPHPPHVHSHSASVLGPRGGGARLPASWDSVTLEVMRGVVWGKVGQGGPALLHYHLHTSTLHLFFYFSFISSLSF